jgi:hypothetical protein
MKTLPFLVRLSLCAHLLLLGGCGSGDPPPAEVPASPLSIGTMTLDFEGAAQIDSSSMAALSAHPAIKEYTAATPERATEPPTAAGSAQNLANLETPLPHTTQPPVSNVERALVRAYLNTPKDSLLASFLGLYSLNKSMLGRSSQAQSGEALKYTLLSQYFLGRAMELGRGEKWIAELNKLAQARIDGVLAKGERVTSEEDHPAHKFFNETFNYHEGDRYVALQRLLDDFVAAPGNVYTNFALGAVNLWVGGEADFDDPTTLENFVLGGFFTVRAMKLAQQLEVAWLANNNATPPFRMASILGGFSVLQRRWLAKVHGDEPAVDALDNEHRQWRLIHRSFHAFTVGLAFFDEPQHFAEGLFAWGDALTHCKEVAVRTCSNLPRFSHNFEGFVLGYVDYLLKGGQVDAAKQFLSIRHVPEQFPPMAAYPDWDLGRAAWEYRESHADEIVALHNNGNPADDPMHLFLKKRQWGQNTSTCQLCHQAQSSKWTEEEKNTIVLPPKEVAIVGAWPAVSTTWYGSSLRAQ